MKERSLNINLKPLLKRLEIVTKKRTMGLGGIQGEVRSYFKGIGLEFADYRLYTPADDSTKIDWKASLRSEDILIKEYMEGRNLTVFLMVDISDSMISGAAEKLKCEYAAEVAASLGAAALESQNTLGYVLYSNKTKAMLMPRRGNKQLFVMARDLSNAYLYGGKNDITKPLHLVMASLPQGSMIILVSDFLNMPSGWNEAIKLLSRKFDVICIAIWDRIDYELPGHGEILLKNIATGKEVLVDVKQAKNQYSKESLNYLNNLHKNIITAGADFMILSTDQPYTNPIRKFFRQRLSKWR